MKRFLLLGENVQHSRSPMLHRDAYAQLDVNASYEARSITASELPGYIDALRAGHWDGFNVTAPFKFAASTLCDREDGPVVNTLWRAEDGAVCGANTDIAGLRAMLSEYAPEVPAGAKAYVMGAGATALSAVEALRAHGYVRVLMVARSMERAQLAADRIGSVGLAPWGEHHDAGAHVIVQATSAGASESLEALQWTATAPKPVVLDVRYGHGPSVFGAKLRADGYQVYDGTRMLAVQAAEAVRLWFGRSVDAERMGVVAFGEHRWRETRKR